MPPTASGTAVTWFSQGEPHLPAGLDWLGPAERARLDTMRYTKRRVEFLVARWTAKQAVALSRGQGIEELHRIQIGHARDGAPVPHVDGVALARRLSMTDRAGWAVCVVSPDQAEVGCDLELVEPRSPAFVADWFTPAEQRLVGVATSDEHRFLLANLVWSAKESALKVLRTGLRRDTRSVDVDLDPYDTGEDWAPLEVRSVEGGTYPGWWCRFGSFLLTTAGERAGGPPQPLAQPPALAAAVPVHSWLAQPVVPPAAGSVLPAGPGGAP